MDDALFGCPRLLACGTRPGLRFEFAETSLGGAAGRALEAERGQVITISESWLSVRRRTELERYRLCRWRQSLCDNVSCVAQGCALQARLCLAQTGP